MSKPSNKAGKPAATAGTTTCAASRLGLNPANPTNRAPSQEPPAPDPAPAPPIPRTPTTARKYLFGQGYINKLDDDITVDILLDQISLAVAHTDTPPAVVAQLRAVILLMPNVMRLANSSTKTLTVLTELVEELAERIPPPGESTVSTTALAALEAKVDTLQECVTRTIASTDAAGMAAVEVQNRLVSMHEELWQTVPARAGARGGQPAVAEEPPHAAEQTRLPGGKPNGSGPPHGKQRAAVDKRLHTQGSPILVEPKEGPLKDNLKGLSARELVQKADLAWAAAWKVLSATDFPHKAGLERQPIILFRTAIRLPRGGIRYEMGTRDQAALLSNAAAAREFEKGFVDVYCRGQGATVLLQCTPITFRPEDPQAIRSLELENALEPGDILAASWVKPENKWGPKQTQAVVRLELRSQELADHLITEGGQLDYTLVVFRKVKQEPTRCLKCQRFGHKAAKCKATTDTCSQCGNSHRSSACEMRDLKHCVSCAFEEHCSYDRACPTFKAKCEHFNQRRPENKSRFFDTARDAQPMNMPSRPIFHPPTSTLADAMPTLEQEQGGRPTRPAGIMSYLINNLRVARPPWGSRGEPARKPREQSADWDLEGPITPPLQPPASLFSYAPSYPVPNVPGRPAHPLLPPSTPPPATIVHATVQADRYTPSAQEGLTQFPPTHITRPRSNTISSEATVRH